jgi:hypothetical protein
MTTTTNPAAVKTIITGARETVRSGPDAEFEAFEELAGKLVQVPKSEIDEKRKGS